MTKPVFFIDMDGCLASQGKIWFEKESLGVYKTISDHDSWAIDNVKTKADIVIISGDERINRSWAKRRGVPFIFTCEKGFHSEKWEYLKEYWYANYSGEPDRQYFYLGDAMPDFNCMTFSKMAFYPSDACITLKRRSDKFGHITGLKSKSGQGVFEEMVNTLIDISALPEDFL